MWNLADRLPSPPTLLRIGLVVFVVAWLFAPYEFQSAIPIWLPFLIALGLEVHFFVSALRQPPAQRPDRGPQSADRERYGYDAEELLLVRDQDQELWIPYSGERGEELEALLDDARELPEEEPATVAEAEAEPERERMRLPLRRFVAGLGLIAVLGLVFWFVESRTGWNGLDERTRAEAAARYSQEASQIAGKPVTIRCDEAGEFVGAVQHADGVAAVGGELAYLTPERCLDLYRLAFKGEVRFNQGARALAVLAHEAWHLRGVSDEGITECYALQSGVELGQRLGDDAPTARRELASTWIERGVPRPGGVPRRRSPRSQCGHHAVPLGRNECHARARQVLRGPQAPPDLYSSRCAARQTTSVINQSGSFSKAREAGPCPYPVRAARATPTAMPGHASHASKVEDWSMATPTSTVHAPVKRYPRHSPTATPR